MSSKAVQFGVGRWIPLVAGVLGLPCAAMASGGGEVYPGDIGQAAAALVIFLLLLVILGRYAWKPIVAQLKRRDEDLAAKLDDATKRQTKADELASEYQQRLSQIEADTQQMLSDARKTAQAEREKLLAETRSEAKDLLHRANEDIQTARSEAQRDLQATIADMAATIAGQVLRKNLTAQEHQRLVKDAAAEVVHLSEKECVS